MIRIGSILALAFCSSVLCAQPSLSIMSLHGQPISTIPAQQPCIIQLTTDEALIKMPEPIGFAQHVTGSTQGSMIKIINGVSTREWQFRWNCVFHKPQVLTIGPIRIETASGTREIPAQLITIVPADAQSPVARIEWSERRLVPGERQRIAFIFVVPFDAPCSDIQCTTPQGLLLRCDKPTRNHSARSRKPMDEIRIEAELCAEKVGDFILGPATISYAVPNHGMFGIFGRFASDQTQLRCPPVTIHVDRLPSHDSLVHAVGRVRSASLKLSRPECTVGSGVSADLHIIGDCTLLLSPEQLVAHHAGIHIYPAHKEEVPGGVRLVYTLQPENPGRYRLILPPLTVFNTDTRRYETVDIAPVELTVSSAVSKTVHDLSHESEQVSDKQQSFGWIVLLAVLAAIMSMLVYWWRMSALREGLRAHSRMRRAENSENFSAAYGELCTILVGNPDPRHAAQQSVQNGRPVISESCARWFLEDGYAPTEFSTVWRSCQKDAQKTARLSIVQAFVRARVRRMPLMKLLAILVIFFLALYFLCMPVAERIIVPSGTVLYYAPREDAALVATIVAEDGEAVILDKHDAWVFVRRGTERGWMHRPDRVTPGA